MCGIVGYSGNEQACDILIESLKRLEYRGYDSAGIAVWNDGDIRVERKKGKVDELRKVTCTDSFGGTLGLAHTRWATHGMPSERNAHPHQAGDVVVVHNGIIENYIELKQDLKKEGHEFLSDTDTEVIPHLIMHHIEKGDDFVSAVRHAISELKGSYALGIIKKNERVLVAAKKESPLIIGVGNGAYYVASDAPAIIKNTNRLIFLEDGDLAVIKDNELAVMDVEGHKIDRKIHQVQWSDAMAEKGGYKHFMLKEIFEQPRAVSDTLLGRTNEESGEIQFEEINLPDIRNIGKIWMVACGTSYHACLIGKHIFEANLRIPVETDVASEFRYRDPIISRNDLLIVVSQSGETADTIAAMKEAKKKGAHVLSVCNVLGSTLAREADGVIFTHAGPEIGVASTKAFTTQISALFMLMLYFGRKLGLLDENEVRSHILELKKIPHKMQIILESAEQIENAARKYMQCRDFLYLGRGIHYPTVLEGALKLKEISYIHAEAYAAGEMKHGPIALIDDQLPVVFVAPVDQTYRKTCGNIEEVIARRGKIVLFTDKPDTEILERVDTSFIIPETIYELQPMLNIIPLQLLAYYIANLLGTDVDQPRNLAKSVTVE
ncbi:MAG TPA: glutamine--fructose-6-phosphate transaminase (isomerizing) [Syntrophorhabdaceae bacterium]|nr:glutamine--fructose-6-phosphate transaminase (isomerizing) [Syntrophorhabdaceae bacterium]